jgi:hypothetical protein
MMGKIKFQLVRLLNSGGRADVHLGYVREASLRVLSICELLEKHLPSSHQRPRCF